MTRVNTNKKCDERVCENFINKRIQKIQYGKNTSGRRMESYKLTTICRSNS